MFVRLYNLLTGWALVIGFLLSLAVGFYPGIDNRKYAFDLAFRFLRFGGAFAVLNGI